MNSVHREAITASMLYDCLVHSGDISNRNTKRKVSHLLDRHIRGHTMLGEQVDGVDLEEPELSLGDSFDMFRGAVQTSLPLRCLRIEVEAELGGDHHPPSEWRERLANQFLVDERTVDLGGIEKRDAPVNGRPDQADHLLLVRRWPVMALMPMQPSPRADTSRLLFPSLRFCIVSSSECHARCSDLRDAMSMEKRYLTSALTSLS